MLERMWRKGNPSALFVGMQTGEATVENSMEFPQKTKNGEKNNKRVTKKNNLISKSITSTLCTFNIC